MIAEYQETLLSRGPGSIGDCSGKPGLLGQVLYLEAEAAGARATGIGCFFDDPVHRVFGLADLAFQSLYHFTVGGAVDDPALRRCRRTALTLTCRATASTCGERQVQDKEFSSDSMSATGGRHCDPRQTQACGRAPRGRASIAGRSAVSSGSRSEITPGR